MKKRIAELDALRGLAALAVVLFHYTTRHEEIFGFEHYFQVKYGHYGVNLFFIISGFVIFLTVSKISNPLEFVYNRGIRLFPTFWACVIITFITINALGPEQLQRSFTEFLFNMTMIPSLLNIRYIDGAYWSLVPELMFYGLMFLLLISKRTSKIVIVGYLWLALILLNHFINLPYFNHLDTLFNLRYGALFLMGINFYKIYNEEANFNNHVQIFLCVITNLIINFTVEYAIVITIFTLIFYMFVFGVIKFIAQKPLLYLGKISYALYLIHQYIGYTLMELLIEYGIKNEILLVIAPLVLSLILSSLILHIVEVPSNKILKGIYKKYAV